METNLDKYNIEESKLIEDIENKNLSYNDVKERCYKLWNLIPFDIDLNPVRLNSLLKEKYSKELEHNGNKTFKIKIGKIPANEIEEYLKKITDKIEKRIIIF